MKEIFHNLIKDKVVKIIITFFVLLSVWWITIYARGLKEGTENNVFTLVYPLFSLVGTIIGFITARKWGGFKSLLGRALSFFTLGLFAQFFGQAAFAYYIYILGIAVPYPSIGDLGYFGSLIFYILGAFSLISIVGGKFSIKSFKGKVFAVLIPLSMLIFSYTFFLSSYQYDWTNVIKVILDYHSQFQVARKSNQTFNFEEDRTIPSHLDAD